MFWRYFAHLAATVLAVGAAGVNYPWAFVVPTSVSE